MRVLVDTCVWSDVLRKNSPDNDLKMKVRDLISDSRVVMIGPIRQELLSGISDNTKFEVIRNKLSAFADIELQSGYFVQAAEFSNRCRVAGIQGSNTDFLICSVACSLNLLIFTRDNDFDQYVKHLPIKQFDE